MVNIRVLQIDLKFKYLIWIIDQIQTQIKHQFIWSNSNQITIWFDLI